MTLGAGLVMLSMRPWLTPYIYSCPFINKGKPMRLLRIFVTLVIVLSALPSYSQSGITASMLRNNELGKLEAALSTLQNQFESSRASEYELRDAFRAFYNLDEVSERNLRNWAAASPKSYAAHLALGIRYKRLGLGARGERSISDTPQRDIDEMTIFLSLSRDELRKSLDLTKKPYLSLFHLLDIEGNFGNRRELETLIQRSNLALPSNYLARYRFAHYLLPRWGGSYKQVDEFIGRCKRENAPANVALGIQAIEYDDLGMSLFEKGQDDAAIVQLVKALEIGNKIGGTFVADLLKRAYTEVCENSSHPQVCKQ